MGSTSCAVPSSAHAFDKYDKLTALHRLRIRGVCSTTLRSMPVHITCQAPYIHLSTSSDSITVLRLEEGVGGVSTQEPQLHVVQADDIVRSGIHHVTIGLSHSDYKNLTIASDKACSLVGLLRSDKAENPTAKHSMAMIAVFEAELPSSITRLRVGNIRPPWQPDLSALPGIISNDIIGSSSDGSLFSFTILDAERWRLLRFIQNMCLRDKTICPHVNTTGRDNEHVEPDERNLRHFHIDGDILKRLLDRGAEERLTAMLDAEPENTNFEGHGYRIRDFDTSQRRKERFFEIAQEALAVQPELDSVVTGSVRFLEQLLQPILQ